MVEGDKQKRERDKLVNEKELIPNLENMNRYRERKRSQIISKRGIKEPGIALHLQRQVYLIVNIYNSTLKKKIFILKMSSQDGCPQTHSIKLNSMLDVDG